MQARILIKLRTLNNVDVTESPAGSAPKAVVSYAAAAVGCSPDAVTDVIRFDQGNRHAVYRVSYIARSGEGADAVVRVSFSGSDVDRAQACLEAAVLTKVGGVAGPALYDFHDESPWFPTPVMCLQFVDGHSRQLALVSPAHIQALGGVVAWLHDQSTEDLDEHFRSNNAIGSYADARLHSILETLSWVRDPLPTAAQDQLHKAAKRLQTSWPQQRESEAFASGEQLALLHGDIGPGNVLWTPAPILIDWEYARIGDPADEIAYLFDQNGLTAKQRDLFWRGYRGGVHVRNHEHVIERATWWAPLTLLGSTLWWVQRYVRRADAEVAGTDDSEAPREPSYYLDQLTMRLDRLNSQLTKTS